MFRRILELFRENGCRIILMSETHKHQKIEPCDQCGIEPGTKPLRELLLCRKCFKKLKKLERKDNSGSEVRRDRLPE